ncbi:hypothetical protein [Paraburkholderia monticola]|nr:hypothetical protein [Paraburkholderia monticola]
MNDFTAAYAVIEELARAASPQAVPAQTRALTDVRLDEILRLAANYGCALLAGRPDEADGVFAQLNALLAAQVSGGDHE